MIPHFNRRRNAWSPNGFSDYKTHYPLTDWQAPTDLVDHTPMFTTAWEQKTDLPSDTNIILTPGLFAEWLPQCFSGARHGFKYKGMHCLRTVVKTRRTVEQQAELITKEILDWLTPDQSFVWCTHSKGGLDALWALDHNAELCSRCSALVMVQLPVGSSQVLDDVQSSTKFVDKLGRRLVGSRWFKEGTDAVSSQRQRVVQSWLESYTPRVPTIQVVSWSIEPTSWADSWHKRLNKLRPGHAHDGQFLMQDQTLNSVPVVCLPRLDHAQPVLGGQGLDCARLWMALAYTARGAT